MIRPLLALALLAACGEEPEAPESTVARPVKQVVVDLDAAGASFHLPGRLAAPVSTELAFQVSGQIRDFPVDEGTRVVAGTVIASIDPRSYEADLAAMRAHVEADKAEFDRQRTRYAEQAGSKAEVDSAQTAYAVGSADLRTTEKAVGDASLRAPFDGVVARKLVSDFANVNVGDPVVLFESTNGLDMLAAVSERDLALMVQAHLDDPTVRSTLEVTIQMGTGKLETMHGRLKEFSVAADRATGAYEARFEVDAPPGVLLLPGMTAEATMALPGLAGVVALPTAAILKDDAGDYVWTIGEGGAVHRTPVTLGDVLPGDETIVTDGLAQGQHVAISGVLELKEGRLVKDMPEY